MLSPRRKEVITSPELSLQPRAVSSSCSWSHRSWDVLGHCSHLVSLPMLFPSAARQLPASGSSLWPPGRTFSSYNISGAIRDTHFSVAQNEQTKHKLKLTSTLWFSGYTVFLCSQALLPSPPPRRFWAQHKSPSFGKRLYPYKHPLWAFLIVAFITLWIDNCSIILFSTLSVIFSLN